MFNGDSYSCPFCPKVVCERTATAFGATLVEAVMLHLDGHYRENIRLMAARIDADDLLTAKQYLAVGREVEAEKDAINARACREG